MSLTILTPLGALLAVGVVVPLVALSVLVARRRASATSSASRNPADARSPCRSSPSSPAPRSSASPQRSRSSSGREIGRVRTDAEAFVVLDVSRSMLAQQNLDSPQRIERAKAAAATLRASLSDVPVGLASLTDRVLPHLFPGTDQEVFAATLERSLGIEKPPPRASFATGATSLNALATLRGLRYFTPKSTKRLAIVLTDGESQPVSNARLGGLFRRSPAIEVVFIQFWNEDERVFSRGVPEPQYIADPSARAALDRLAASTQGAVYSENQLDAATSKAHDLLASGPSVVEGEKAGQVALAPYLAAAALLPFGLLLWRRDR